MHQALPSCHPSQTHTKTSFALIPFYHHLPVTITAPSVQLFLKHRLTFTSQAEKITLQQTMLFPLKNQKPVLMMNLHCLGNAIHADKSTTVPKMSFPHFLNFMWTFSVPHFAIINLDGDTFPSPAPDE